MTRTLRCLFLALPVLFAAGAYAQNPVPNPSFDTQTDCPAPDDIDFAPPWISASNATPDLFNSTCPTQNLTAHSGIGSSGVYVFGPFANYREYMQAPLTTPLVTGQGYCVSVWVKRANFRYGADGFGLYFSTTAVDLNGTGVMAYTPQVQNAAGTILSGTSWQQIQGAFVAAGGEDYITIGNFSNDANTTTEVLNAGSSSEVAYYYIDDVVVLPCNVGLDELEAGAFELFPQPALDQVTIRMARNMALQEVLVLDASGRTIRSLRPGSPAGTYDIQVQDLPEGLYQLLLITDQGTAVRRMMVAR